MANEEYYVASCEAYDHEYEETYAVPIAFERRRVDEKITPKQILPAAIIAANMGVACHILKTLA
jgi:hypothetical protein